MNSVKSYLKKIGTPPGTLVYTGERKVETIQMTIADWDENNIKVIETTDPSDCFKYRESKNVTWINVEGLHDVEVLNRLGTDFGIHPLVLEDILNTSQRPKIEDHGSYIYIVMKHLMIDEGTYEVRTEQISLLMVENTVFSFQEGASKVFDPIMRRLERPDSRLRKAKADYLVYALMDILIDNYLLVLKIIEDRMICLDEELTGDIDEGTLSHINLLRRQMINIHRSISPLREVMTELNKGDSVFIKEEMGIYFRDLRDHWYQAMEATDGGRDVLSHMLDVYLSLVSNKMNDIMKVLTIIATIFIPITFIAGVYGMNFNNMPELDAEVGYPLALTLMLAMALAMVYFFRRKGWL